MPIKIKTAEAKQILVGAALNNKHEFILEMVASRAGRVHLRLKGRNGEIVMHQEDVFRDNAIRVAARIVSAGLNIKFKDLTHKAPAKTTTKTK